MKLEIERVGRYLGKTKIYANEILAWRNSSRFVKNYTLIILYTI